MTAEIQLSRVKKKGWKSSVSVILHNNLIQVSFQKHSNKFHESNPAVKSNCSVCAITSPLTFKPVLQKAILFHTPL